MIDSFQGPPATIQMDGTSAEAADAELEVPPEHPELHRLRIHRNRKYGANDYERFDHLGQWHASLGSAKFGKARIDCRFLFTKSKWGVMGKHGTPAGIVYLDLTFHEPKGCRLHSATVTVTLDEKHKELTKIRRRSAQSTRHPVPPPPGAAVQMTDCYGPKGFVGPDKSVEKKKTIEVKPSVEVGGFGGSLINFSKESTFKSTNRWKFSTHLIPGEERDWNYESIQWELSENDIERESAHSDTVHTAFAFQHGNQPFFLKLDVDGHLRGMRGAIRNKLSQFRASTKLDKSTAVTLINFGEQHVFTKSLDFTAKNLHFEMERANLLSIPMVVPDPQPVTFQTSETTKPPINTSETTTHTASSGNSSTANPLPNWPPRPLIERGERPTRPWDTPQSVQQVVAGNQPKPPALEDLAKVINTSFLPANRPNPRSTHQQNGRVHSPARTIPVQDLNGEIHMNGSARTRSTALANSLRSSGELQRKSNVPGFLVFMQLLLVLRNFLDRMLDEGDTTPEAKSNSEAKLPKA